MEASQQYPPSAGPPPKRKSFSSRRVYRRETVEPQIKTPMKIDDFELMRTVGTGSYSRVVLARHRLSNAPVALKTLVKADVVKSSQVTRIYYEKSILRFVQSPFVVGFFGTFQDKCHLYLALEYVSGGELFKLMIDNDRFTEQQCLFYAAEITYALADLHAINCIYRDLKPENILITATGHIKLTDFGCAKMINFHTRTFTLCGTPEYLAPEVIDRNGHSVVSDWWQLGILIFEMMAAYPPFSDQSPYRLYEKILLSKVEYPKFFNPGIVSFLSGLLTKDPRDRLNDQAVERHPFFSTINWDDVKNRELRPPFIPRVRDSMDSSNFEQFEEEGEIEPSMPEWDRLSPRDEDSLSLSTSSTASLSLSPKFKTKSWNPPSKLAHPSTVHSLKQAISKCRQLISADKEKISQLKSECEKLAGKAIKLESSAKELQLEVCKPKAVAERIHVQKRKSVQLEEEITGLKTSLGEFAEVEKAVKKASDDLSIFKGDNLSSLSLTQCALLFSQKCLAVQRITTALSLKLQSMEDAELCIVCVSCPRNTILVPCGHLLLCWNCCGSLKTCPVCRASIDDRFQTGCSDS